MAPLRALVAAGHQVVMAVSRADARRGRGPELSPSPVKRAATELGIPVTDRVADVTGSGAELGVVVAFGRLIRPEVLEAVPMVNLHFSLLPRWRGAAPVERALLAGDERTGVCVMALDEGLDTGPLYTCREVPIGPEQTAAALRAELGRVGTDLLVELLATPLPEPRPQQGEATYATKIDADELRLDWARPAAELHRVVRVGGAWTTFRGRRLKVLAARLADEDDGDPLGPGELDGPALRVGCGRGILDLVEVQPEGRGPQPAAAWRNGARLRPRERLG